MRRGEMAVWMGNKMEMGQRVDEEKVAAVQE